MSGTKTWSVGEVLTAADLNGNFTKLPFAMSAFTVNGPGTTIAANSYAFVSVAFPSARFSVAPIVTLSTSASYITPVVDDVTSGTVVIALVNNGASSQPPTIKVYGNAIQMSSGTAAG